MISSYWLELVMDWRGINITVAPTLAFSDVSRPIYDRSRRLSITIICAQSPDITALSKCDYIMFAIALLAVYILAPSLGLISLDIQIRRHAIHMY